ncbi:hypothetical protein KX928_06425 [Roseobacter sp. YSTF-M11]|uniref:Uncharacterized protein n=1 Tax=Roseobacter insulae TaxID=2859783 RepID=A0A9X1FU32_9RHOB|nr:hypothetical protein [Roseobacter insulae]MBW4707417.1 hypothetical protein [Roseobacter insulae]
MNLGLHMLSFLRRQRGSEAAEPAPEDLRLLAPLSELLEEARPGQGLLDNIESELNAVPGRKAIGSKRLGVTAAPVLYFAAGIVTAALLTVAGNVVFRDDPQIILRPSQEENWLPLGSVSLHGDALRTFVASKCRGQSHLVINLSGYLEKENSRNSPRVGGIETKPVMTAQEKIMMGCIR